MTVQSQSASFVQANAEGELAVCDLDWALLVEATAAVSLTSCMEMLVGRMDRSCTVENNSLCKVARKTLWCCFTRAGQAQG